MSEAAESDPTGLAARLERVLLKLRDQTGTPCARCASTLCGHAVVFGIVSGYEDAPLCLPCLAGATARDAELLRDEMMLFVHSKPCLTQGWRLASLREGQRPDGIPPCLATAAAAPEPQDAEAPPAHVRRDLPPITDRLDAGDQACGELVLALRVRLDELPAGAVLHLTALDPGAREDLPAWCRLTGNRLLRADHPEYFIESRRSS